MGRLEEEERASPKHTEESRDLTGCNTGGRFTAEDCGADPGRVEADCLGSGGLFIVLKSGGGFVRGVWAIGTRANGLRQ